MLCAKVANMKLALPYVPSLRAKRTDLEKDNRQKKLQIEDGAVRSHTTIAMVTVFTTSTNFTPGMQAGRSECRS